MQSIWHQGKQIGELRLTALDELISHFLGISILVLTGSILSNIALSAYKRLSSWSLINARKETRLAEDMVKRLQIKTTSLELPVASMSGGNQQKIVLAKWLAMSPSLLILDSPTVGIDVGAKNGLYETIRASAASGMGILMISDEMPELLANCDRIHVMRNGRLIREFPASGLTEADLRNALELDGEANFRRVGG